MDIIEITPTHQLQWMLLVFLLTWMIIFAWLAIRQTPEAKSEMEEVVYRPVKVATTTQHIEAAKQEQAVTIKHEANKETYLEQSVH
jgi:hypothetical protein